MDCVRGAHAKVQILGSAYILGASSEHLSDIYEKESKELEPWRDSPGEISTFDWRDYLGERRWVIFVAMGSAA